MRTTRRLLVMGSMLALLTTAGPVSAGAAKELGTDITATVEGQANIQTAVESFEAQGSAAAVEDFVAKRLPDGAVLVVAKGLTVGLTAAGDGYRVAPPAPKDGGVTKTRIVALATGSWTLTGSQCFAALFRGASHMDTCYRGYKMSTDGDATKDYWRLDLYATMFAEGRTLDWGWVAADQDAGPAMQFVDWSPDADVRQNCATFGLSISVLGVGGGYNRTFCELNNISKSAGAALGWFKDEWSWDGWIPVQDRDRAVGIQIGTSTTQGGGSPTWGLSWNFASH